MAVVDVNCRVLDKRIENTTNLANAIADLLARFPVSVIILGDRTNSKPVREHLKSFGVKIVMVDEDRSSLEGRYRFLKENTLGWRRWLPIGLRAPNRPFDDYVAVVLAERYLNNHSSGKQ